MKSNYNLNLGSRRYKIKELIGEGTYSKVHLASLESKSVKCQVACKIINVNDDNDTYITKFLPREIGILRRISHPNIIKVLDIVEQGNKVYLFMEYCSKGDLLEYVRRKGILPENKTKNIFRQIVNAIYYLHSLNISHRDLKCENIFLTAHKHVKVGDFGFSRLCCNDETNTRVLSNTFCGSTAYAAPEILRGLAYYPKMYDIWSLGCILYIMLCGSMPFDDSNIKNMLRFQQSKLVYGVIYSKFELSGSLKVLLCKLLEPDVSKRINIRKVAKCKWLDGVKINKWDQT